MTGLVHLLVGSIVVLPVFYVPTLTLTQLAACVVLAIGLGACFPETEM